MKAVKNFLIETVVLTVAVIGWGILKMIRFVQVGAGEKRDNK